MMSWERVAAGLIIGAVIGLPGVGTAQTRCDQIDLPSGEIQLPLDESKLAIIVDNATYRPDSGWARKTIDTTVPGSGGAMAKLFYQAGFCVVRRSNLTLEQMKSLMGGESGKTEIGARIGRKQGSKLLVVMFVGHGQTDGSRDKRDVLLAPIDGNRRDLTSQYSLSLLQNTLRNNQNSERINIIMVDACRNNTDTDRPALPTEVSELDKTATLGGPEPTPKVVVEPGADVKHKTLILYATYETSKAMAVDRSGEMVTAWTGAFVKHAQPKKAKGVNLLDIVRNTEETITQTWDGTQLPAMYGSVSLMERVVLFPKENEDEAWKRAQELGTYKGYLEFITAFPDSRHVRYAAQRLAQAKPDVPTLPPVRPQELPAGGEVSQQLMKRQLHIIQSALKAVIKKPRNTDGILNKETTDAIQEYQMQRGADVTGILTDKQLVALLKEAGFERGDKLSLNALGRLYFEGEIVNADIETAITIFKALALKDFPAAIPNLGLLLAANPDFDVYQEACMWLGKSRNYRAMDSGQRKSVQEWYQKKDCR